jgi:hypothetical protein
VQTRRTSIKKSLAQFGRGINADTTNFFSIVSAIKSI